MLTQYLCVSPEGNLELWSDLWSLVEDGPVDPSARWLVEDGAGEPFICQMAFDFLGRDEIDEWEIAIQVSPHH